MANDLNSINMWKDFEVQELQPANFTEWERHLLYTEPGYKQIDPGTEKAGHQRSWQPEQKPEGCWASGLTILRSVLQYFQTHCSSLFSPAVQLRLDRQAKKCYRQQKLYTMGPVISWQMLCINHKNFYIRLHVLIQTLTTTVPTVQINWIQLCA